VFKLQLFLTKVCFYKPRISIGLFHFLFWFWRNTFWKLAVYSSPVKRITLSCQFLLFLNNFCHQKIYLILSPDGITRKVVLFKLFIYLFVHSFIYLIYLHSNRSKSVGKPTAYRTSLNESIYMQNTYKEGLKWILLHYYFTPWCRVLLEKLTGLQLVKKFPTFYGTWRFITALTSLRHPSLSWASPIQSIYPHPTSWRSILILSTHLRLVLHNYIKVI